MDDSRTSKGEQLPIDGANLSIVEEQQVLDATIDVLRQEEVALRKRKRFWRTIMDPFNPAEVQMANRVAAQHSEVSDVVNGRQAYYARFDVIEDGGQTPKSYCLSKTLHLNDTRRSGGAFVIHWTSPMAGAFAGQSLRVQSETFRGEALLKRRFWFEQGQPHRIGRLYDELIRYTPSDAITEAIGGETFLQHVLRLAGPRARSIVASIAKEQDELIRLAASGTLVIDGVPGSGKSQIGQMRTAFLITNVNANAETRVAEDRFAILAPSLSLLSYLEEVLPDLGVLKVRSSTIDARLQGYVGLKNSLPPAGPRAGPRQTLHFGQLIESHIQFLVSKVAQQLASAELPMGQNWELSRSDVEAGYSSIASRPLVEHRAQFVEALMRPVIQQLAQHLPSFRDQVGRPSTDTDTDYARAAAAAKSELHRWVEKWVPDYASVEDLYLGALNATGEFTELTSADLPGLALVQLRRTGRTEQVRHLVIDEGQRVAPLTYQLMRRIAPWASFTILGDMSQRDSSNEGIRDWTELESLGYDSPTVRRLQVNYRSTPQIVSVLNAIGARIRPSFEPMASIERSAEPVIAVSASDRDDVTLTIALLLERWTPHTAAILCADNARADEVTSHLRDLLPKLDVSRLRHSDIYAGGIVVGTGKDVAGLEFDAVIVLDADEANFPDTDEGAAQLFALASRAQNRLYFAYVSRLTPLLRDLELVKESAQPVLINLRDLPKWEGTGSYSRREVGWGYAYPRDPSGRFITTPTPGITEDRYDDESTPDDAPSRMFE